MFDIKFWNVYTVIHSNPISLLLLTTKKFIECTVIKYWLRASVSDRNGGYHFIHWLLSLCPRRDFNYFWVTIMSPPPLRLMEGHKVVKAIRFTKLMLKNFIEACSSCFCQMRCHLMCMFMINSICILLLLRWQLRWEFVHYVVVDFTQEYECYADLIGERNSLLYFTKININ